MNHPEQDNNEPAPQTPSKRQWLKPALEVIPMRDAMSGLPGHASLDGITGYS